MAIEKSTVANAGLGCNLTHSGTAELESSFASVSREVSCYGSVAAVAPQKSQHSCSLSEALRPTVSAAAAARVRGAAKVKRKPWVKLWRAREGERIK